jgi:hypothetical protein
MGSKERSIVGFLIVATASACGEPELESQTEVAALLGASKPRAMYIPVPEEHLTISGAVDTLVGRPRRGGVLFAGPGQAPLPIFLNRNGGTYSPGPDDSRQNTSIVPNGVSTIDPFSGTNAEWQGVVDCMTDMFSRFNAVIVETEPVGGEYIEAVISGRPQDVGLPNGVGGVAPIDTSRCRIIPNAIVYAFAEVYGGNSQDICETTAQEVAHALSLGHEFYCPDPMTYLGGCGDKEFRDYDAQCGEYQAVPCDCNRALQNSVEVIIDKLGAFSGVPPPPPPNDPLPPTVSIASPSSGATLPDNSTITIEVDATDNFTVAATELVWQFSNTTFPCPYTGNGGAVTCTRSGTRSTWSLRVGQGDRTFYAVARDSVGNEAQTPPITIHLGTAPPPPPGDTTPPVVAITSPAPNATVPANSTLQITATASDNNALASVELMWIFSGDAFQCPFNGQGVSCAVNGNTYTWNVTVGVGTRRFAVRAIDLAGNITTTAEQDIILNTAAPPPTNPGGDLVAEDNDRWGQTFPARCGTAIDLSVQNGDEDWFSYDVLPGVMVQIGINAAVGSVVTLEILDDAQAQLAVSTNIVDDGGVLAATSNSNKIYARVTTPSPNVSYRLSAICASPPEMMNPPAMNPPAMNPPAQNPENNDQGFMVRGPLGGGCGCDTIPGSSGSASAMLALLAIGFVLRRR